MSVGTAQRPGRQAPPTGSQDRKDLIKSESPEREIAKAKNLESEKQQDRLTRFDRKSDTKKS
ncbi:hypothetical protein J7E92_28315, partial [Streptomyces sp. ISL-63]|uniref:hypothetical protein n=1 Tax=Streptomyces sp. ISL-63 TaxID=2819185 RepID=UPI001BECC287